MERIYFENSKGVRLCGILSKPSNKTTKIVVMAHGLASSKESEKYVRLQEILNSKGVATLRFDFYGHGQSEGVYEEFTIMEGEDDVLRAINFVRDLGFEEIGLVGSSIGGISSIMAASVDDDLKFLGLVAPVCSPEELPVVDEHEDAMKLNNPVNEDKEHNGYEVAKKIKIPTLIIHGDKDVLVPLNQSKKMCELMDNCKLIVLPGADHRFSNPLDYQKVINMIEKFVEQNFFN